MCNLQFISIKVKSRLRPSLWDLFEPNQINFLVVRHPLDRILSAFKDRILNQNTDQVKYLIKLLEVSVWMNDWNYLIVFHQGQETLRKDEEISSCCAGRKSANIFSISAVYLRSITIHHLNSILWESGGISCNKWLCQSDSHKVSVRAHIECRVLWWKLVDVKNSFNFMFKSHYKVTSTCLISVGASWDVLVLLSVQRRDIE